MTLCLFGIKCAFVQGLEVVCICAIFHVLCSIVCVRRVKGNIAKIICIYYHQGSIVLAVCAASFFISFHKVIIAFFASSILLLLRGFY